MVDNELLSAISDMLDSKLQPIASHLETIKTRMGSVESRLDSMESKIDSIETRLVSVETKVDSIDSTVKENRKLFLDFYGEQKEHNTGISQKMDELGACVEIFSNQTIKNTAELKRIK